MYSDIFVFNEKKNERDVIIILYRSKNVHKDLNVSFPNSKTF